MSNALVSKMLREGLYTRIVGRRISYFELLQSTMDEGARRAESGVEEGTVILTEQQSAGRGRFNREWVSRKGNLYLSIVLRPPLNVLQYLSIMSGVAVVRAIKNTTGLNPSIKWPNDVRLSGKKVSGILVEDALEGNVVAHAIVGIGVNVTFDPSSVVDLESIATSLEKESKGPIDRESLLRNLLQEMDRLYLGLMYGAGAKPVLAEWRSHLETLGQHVEVTWLGDVHSGYAEDVDESGNLLLRTQDDTLKVLPAGEVTFAHPS